ncbi:MAG: septum formation inhibitor Maf [Clostridiaceae bacterium]|nr:septum formation inhibitor Maf [Clostridiaceae bacterium]
MNHLILASASPRRQELLRLITEEFTVVPADADETLPAGLPVANQIEVLAERKAADIFAKHPDSVVIGSDTMVVIDGQPLGKPADADDARRMLKMLSGRAHEVITGLAVLSPVGSRIGHRTTKVQFRDLSDGEIERYLATGEPLDKAGAYGIQGKGATLITGIDGDYFSVVGLPVSMLYTMLDELGQLE